MGNIEHLNEVIKQSISNYNIYIYIYIYQVIEKLPGNGYENRITDHVMFECWLQREDY